MNNIVTASRRLNDLPGMKQITKSFRNRQLIQSLNMPAFLYKCVDLMPTIQEFPDNVIAQKTIGSCNQYFHYQYYR